MKRSLLIFASCLLISTASMAQAPNLFNYQGVAHDASGPLDNQAVGIKISIINNSANGIVVYSESHVDTTNAFGLYTLSIGSGTILSGTMGSIDWTSGDKYINIAIDPNGGTTYADLGTTQLLSVPYALFAGNAPIKDTALGIAGGDLTGNFPNPTIANNAITTAKLNQMGATTGDILIWNGINWTVDSVPVDSSVWSLDGNNIDSTAFIGTLNDEDIRFKRNGILIGRIESYNITFGNSALKSNTTGFYNNAIGFSALQANTTGSGNNAIGNHALYINTSGSSNNAYGENALKSNSRGSFNIAIGNSAGFNNKRGSYLTMVGSFADVNDTSYNSSGSFGTSSRITASYQYRIGATTGTSSIGGRVGWTTTSDGRFKTNVKEDVIGLAFIQQLRPVTYNLDGKKIEEFIGIDKTKDAIEMPELVHSQWTEVFSGFIAQEVEATAKKLGYDFHGVDQPKNDKDYYGLRYAEFVVPLVKAVQEQQEMIELQNKKIEDLERLVQELLKE